MARIRLIHWNQEEAIERAGRLRALGHRVEAEPIQASGSLTQIRNDPPEAFVIDLSRLPSHGRAIGEVLRTGKTTRLSPLVFVDGAAEKVQRVRDLLPDATYTDWKGIGPALRRALAHPPREPLVPGSKMPGYSGTPLPKKLGLKVGSVVNLIGAPKDFERTLGPLPDGARLKRTGGGMCDLMLWFVESRRGLNQRFETAERLVRDGGGMWIIWPKQASGVKTDVGERLVREIALGRGWVDYKICAVDQTWSGLKFARKRRDKASARRAGR